MENKYMCALGESNCVRLQLCGLQFNHKECYKEISI